MYIMDHFLRTLYLACGCMVAQVKVRECGLRLLRLYKLNAGPVCDENAAECSLCANVALYKLNLPYLPFYLSNFVTTCHFNWFIKYLCMFTKVYLLTASILLPVTNYSIVVLCAHCCDSLAEKSSAEDCDFMPIWGRCTKRVSLLTVVSA